MSVTDTWQPKRPGPASDRDLVCTFLGNDTLGQGTFGTWHMLPSISMVDSVTCLRYAECCRTPDYVITDMASRCRLLAAHGARSCLSVRTQPLTATGAPSQTSTIPCHAVCHTIPCRLRPDPPDFVHDSSVQADGKASLDPLLLLGCVGLRFGYAGPARGQPVLQLCSLLTLHAIHTSSELHHTIQLCHSCFNRRPAAPASWVLLGCIGTWLKHRLPSGWPDITKPQPDTP